MDRKLNLDIRYATYYREDFMPLKTEKTGFKNKSRSVKNVLRQGISNFK